MKYLILLLFLLADDKPWRGDNPSWKEVVEASRSDAKYIKLTLKVNSHEIRPESDKVDLYLSDRGKEQYVTTFTYLWYLKTTQECPIFLEELMKHYKTPPSSSAKFILSSADLVIEDYKIEIISKK